MFFQLKKQLSTFFAVALLTFCLLLLLTPQNILAQSGNLFTAPKQETCQSGTGINTAIGCIPALTDNPTDLYAFLLRWAIGIGGGISFLLIVLAGFQILTSQGNPDRLKAGQELLTSAIMGLILLVFSAFILRIIGVDILAIPGF